MPRLSFPRPFLTLSSPLPRPPQVVIQIAFAVAALKSNFPQKEMEEVKYQLWKVALLSDWQATLARLCDCSFLYYVTNLVPAFLQDMYAQADQAHRLQYLLAALRDVQMLVLRTPPGPAGNAHMQAAREFEGEVEAALHDHLVSPLCRDVETDLRLHIHSVVLENPGLRGTGPQRDLTRLLALAPVRLFDQLVDFRSKVTHYLDATFYNLNTVSLHDWRVYAEMRNLAAEKYGLR